MPLITQIALYVRDLQKVADFYRKHFDFYAVIEAADKMRLVSAAGGCEIVLLQASKGHKIGQSTVKIIFDVEDIESFKQQKATEGLPFGATHSGIGYQFANARDPAENLIQISSFRFGQNINRAEQSTAVSA